MAGPCKACTHVSVMLFAVEATVKIRDGKTVTEEKTNWLLPGRFKCVTYDHVSDIDFTAAKTKRKLWDIFLSSPQKPVECEDGQCSCDISIGHACFFCENLHGTGKRAGISTCLFPFSNNYVPASVRDNFPPLLAYLFDENSLEMNYSDRVDHCHGLIISVSAEQAEAVETAT